MYYIVWLIDLFTLQYVLIVVDYTALLGDGREREREREQRMWVVTLVYVLNKTGCILSCRVSFGKEK